MGAVNHIRGPVPTSALRNRKKRLKVTLTLGFQGIAAPGWVAGVEGGERGALRTVKRIHSGRRLGVITMETAMTHEPDFIRDTDPAALEVFYEIQRRRSRDQKANDVFELSEWMIQLAEAGVRLRYPGIREREVFLRAAALCIPRELMIKAYGWDPEAHE